MRLFITRRHTNQLNDTFTLLPAKRRLCCNSSLFVGLSVCLSAALLKKLWMNTYSRNLAAKEYAMFWNKKILDFRGDLYLDPGIISSGL